MLITALIISLAIKLFCLLKEFQNLLPISYCCVAPHISFEHKVCISSTI